MFSGSFGVRSIVLCKCSGKYIDIYFNLKITYWEVKACVYESVLEHVCSVCMMYIKKNCPRVAHGFVSLTMHNYFVQC